MRAELRKTFQTFQGGGGESEKLKNGKLATKNCCNWFSDFAVRRFIYFSWKFIFAVLQFRNFSRKFIFAV